MICFQFPLHPQLCATPFPFPIHIFPLFEQELELDLIVLACYGVSPCYGVKARVMVSACVMVFARVMVSGNVMVLAHVMVLACVVVIARD